MLVYRFGIVASVLSMNFSSDIQPYCNNRAKFTVYEPEIQERCLSYGLLGRVVFILNVMEIKGMTYRVYHPAAVDY